jgi:hypothetical protein
VSRDCPAHARMGTAPDAAPLPPTGSPGYQQPQDGPPVPGPYDGAHSAGPAWIVQTRCNCRTRANTACAPETMLQFVFQDQARLPTGKQLVPDTRPILCYFPNPVTGAEQTPVCAAYGPQGPAVGGVGGGLAGAVTGGGESVTHWLGSQMLPYCFTGPDVDSVIAGKVCASNGSM